MSYTRTDWRTEETPVSAGNLNNIEDGIEEALDVTRNLRENIATLALDIFYPVGSYYETSKSTSEFNPGTAWGGTWELESSGLVHVSAGTGYSVGSTGGSATHVHSTANHTLTASEIPAHTHGSKTLTGTMRVMAWANAATSGIVSISNQDKNKNPSSGSNEGAATFTINASHTHNSVGGSGGHNHGNTGSASNYAPYIVVNRWHRTA